MKAVGVLNGKGNADALFIEDNVPDPVPKSGYILVSIKAFGLNRMDIMQREDRYPYPLLPESGKIMGVEFSGIVLELGADCSAGFNPGDKVFGLAYGGALPPNWQYAEKISVSERMLMHMPSNMNFETAAGIPETYFTAIQAIHLVGGLEKGQSVLIHAGASGVGQAAIQIAKHGGASKVYVTAGTPEKCQLCTSLGADVAICYRTEDFAKVIEQDTDGRGVDLVIDLVGRDYWHRNMASLAMDSKMVLVAAMSGNMVDDFNLRALLNKRIWVMATTLRTRNTEYQGRLRDKFVEVALPYLTSGEMKITVDKVHPWTDVGAAHKRMESNANAGKIICRIE
ncbi:putative quinone oxidoreductase [Phaeomoniella chlamydospora]|uniref:Putative quinone oxidoreductase n=1 Tax=Phaeomoniella chlamydospora TaxID=158046 RepID=A0A0G2GWW3_PHACM|nr:putative quinone oxidoreductase [Phaeomoniella chlamydospora]